MWVKSSIKWSYAARFTVTEMKPWAVSESQWLEVSVYIYKKSGVQVGSTSCPSTIAA